MKKHSIEKFIGCLALIVLTLAVIFCITVYVASAINGVTFAEQLSNWFGIRLQSPVIGNRG